EVRDPSIEALARVRGQHQPRAAGVERDRVAVVGRGHPQLAWRRQEQEPAARTAVVTCRARALVDLLVAVLIALIAQLRRAGMDGGIAIVAVAVTGVAAIAVLVARQAYVRAALRHLVADVARALVVVLAARRSRGQALLPVRRAQLEAVAEQPVIAARTRLGP